MIKSEKFYFSIQKRFLLRFHEGIDLCSFFNNKPIENDFTSIMY